jgi:hypothetical protein
MAASLLDRLILFLCAPLPTVPGPFFDYPWVAHQQR